MEWLVALVVRLFIASLDAEPAPPDQQL